MNWYALIRLLDRLTAAVLGVCLRVLVPLRDEHVDPDDLHDEHVED